MLVERLGDVVGELVRRVIANVDQMTRPHHGRDRSIDAAKQRERHRRAEVARLSGESRDQRLLELEKHEIVQLRCLVPRPLLRRVCEEAGADEHVSGRSPFPRHAAVTGADRWHQTSAFGFQIINADAVVLKNDVVAVPAGDPGWLFAILDLPEIRDAGFLAGGREDVRGRSDDRNDAIVVALLVIGRVRPRAVPRV